MDFQQSNTRRPVPSFAPAQDVAQPSPVQGYAAAHSREDDEVQADAPVPLSPVEEGSDYTVSVEEVLIRPHNLGIDKSKDTIQRYCREGDLACEKLGMLRRYFATENSVGKLIEKLQPDADAFASTQVHEAAPELIEQDVQLHAVPPIRDNAENNNPHQPASKDTKADEAEEKHVEQPHAGASASAPVIADHVQIAALSAEVKAQKTLISTLEKTNDQLWEEVVESRGNRKDVTKISERMLLTLEAMALGGRLERPKTNPETEQKGSEAPRHADVEIVETYPPKSGA